MDFNLKKKKKKNKNKILLKITYKDILEKKRITIMYLNYICHT